MALRGKLIYILGYIVLVALLTLSCGLGAYAAYIAMITSLVALLVACDFATLKYFLAQVWVRMFLVAYALIAVAFLLTAENVGEALFVFDFLPLVLVIPAGFLFKKMASCKAIHHLAMLSFFGVVCAFVLIVYGVFVLNISRPSGIENSPIHFSYFSLILGFLSLSGYFVEGKRPNWIFLLGPVLGLIAAILTGTRGSIVVLMFLLLVLLAFFIMHIGLNTKKKCLAIAGVPIIGITVLFGAHSLGVSRAFVSLLSVTEVLQGKQFADASMAYRLEHVSAGVKAFFDAPWVGHGWNNQLASALPYMSEFGRAGYANENWAYLHNEAISLAVSAGAMGLVAYFLIFTAPIVGVMHSVRDSQFGARAYAISIIVAGIFAGGLTEVLFKYELPKAFLCLIIAALLLYCRDEDIDIKR